MEGSAALNDHINLYGFWNETAFLTKSGDVGMVLRVPGVDYESLDHAGQEYAVKRLEAALKLSVPASMSINISSNQTGRRFRLPTTMTPLSRPPSTNGGSSLKPKRDHLYQVEIFYCIAARRCAVEDRRRRRLARLFRDPAGAIGELKTQFTSDSMKTLLRSQIEAGPCAAGAAGTGIQPPARRLHADRSAGPAGPVSILPPTAQLRPWRIAGKPQSTQFLDYQVVNSNIEAERDHLRVGDHFVRVLTMKEAITETRPLVLDAL